MDQKIIDKAKSWLGPEYDHQTREEVEKLLAGDPKKLEDAFYTDLEFGTGGLRGEMGAGTNRMNVYTVSMATQGLANYINKSGENTVKSVAIAHDSRKNSHVFARKAAEVFTANGIKVFLFPELRPTPQLSFAVRHFGCTSGIVITASHNPKEYNGYKVYWNDGGQIVSPQDKAIIEEVRAVKGPAEVKTEADQALIEVIGTDLDVTYRKTLLKESIHSESIADQADMPIVYTALHGTGITQIPPLLEEMGFKNIHKVKEQEKPDGDFPTVHSPNPEEKAALDLALKLGKEVDAEIIMGTDPDADRVGIAVKNTEGELVLLNGNETASILTHYILKGLKEKGRLPDNGFVCRTIVTTELIDRIADKFGVKHYHTLTGFKYIAEKIRALEGKEKFICGGEESYGFMVGDAVRDKDAVVTGAMLCEVAAWAKSKGSSFYEELIAMYAEYGFFREALVSLVKKGKDGAEQIAAMMDRFRTSTPGEIAGSKVVEMRDYKTGEIKDMRTGKIRPTHLPASNVIQFYLEDGSKVTARPSGTEPKIKFYFSLQAQIEGKRDFEKTKNSLDRRIEELKEAFVHS
jgi:phosphoglucomutase